MRETLVFLEYLERGLVPVQGFRQEDVKSFDLMLSELSEKERRRVNRKFRKIFRQIYKSAILDKNKPTAGWARVYGVGSSNPTKAQLRARRRLVHDEIIKSVEKRIKNA